MTPLTALLLALSSPAVLPQVPSPAAAASLSAGDQARRALQAAVTKSIVTVTAYERVPDGVAHEGRWAVADESAYPGFARAVVSSGIVVGNGGTVICCRSPLVLENGGLAEQVDVETSSGVRVEAELLGSEPTINLAVLRLKPAAGQALGDLAPARIGKVDSLETGDSVFAVADPFGAARTFAPGVVMALPVAACYQADLTGSFIHGSMAISPESVGGALVNASGEVLGMMVPPPSLQPSERLQPHAYVTYSMQIDTALGVAEALTQKRSNHSPWTGFSVLSQQELKARMKDDAAFAALPKPAFGLLVDDLYDPSPATAAGVRRGDFVTEINGTKIMGVVDFQQSLYYFSGTQVPVKFFRDGKDLTVMLKIEERPAAANRN